MTDYVGVIDQSEGKGGVRFPDPPGCRGAGASADSAIRDAASAAREWILNQAGEGLAQPMPRAVDEILATEDIDAAAGEAAMLIDEGRFIAPHADEFRLGAGSPKPGDVQGRPVTDESRLAASPSG